MTDEAGDGGAAEDTADGFVYRRTHRTYKALWYGMSMAGVAGALALGLSGEVFGGYAAGMLLGVVAMLSGLMFWGERFVHQRWLPRAQSLRIDEPAHSYRERTSPKLRVDDIPRQARSVTVSTSRRPTDGRPGAYTVILDSDQGLVDVDEFAGLPSAMQVGTSLAEALGVPLQRASPGTPGAAVTPGTFVLMLLPVLLYAPSLFLLDGHMAWTPALVLAAHAVAFVLLSTGLRRSSGADEEARFRAASKRTTQQPRVRVEVEPGPMADPAEETLEASDEQRSEIGR